MELNGLIGSWWTSRHLHQLVEYETSNSIVAGLWFYPAMDTVSPTETIATHSPSDEMRRKQICKIHLVLVSCSTECMLPREFKMLV